MLCGGTARNLQVLGAWFLYLNYKRHSSLGITYSTCSVADRFNRRSRKFAPPDPRRDIEKLRGRETCQIKHQRAPRSTNLLSTHVSWTLASRLEKVVLKQIHLADTYVGLPRLYHMLPVHVRSAELPNPLPQVQQVT